MFFLGFDDPLIEAWLEGDTRPLRPELHREDTAPEDRALERLEIPAIKPAPDIAREPIERPTVHSLDHPAPTRDDDRRRR